MSHHSSEPPRKEMHDLMKKVFGEFPDGKLNAQDEGGLAMAVGIEEGGVRLQFPKPVAWVAMTPDEAIGLAESLVKNARKAGSSTPLQLHIG